MMKLLISNQHGAIVMALFPFCYGWLTSQPIWQSVFLFLAWCALYLMSYPFFNLFKGRNLELYQKWSLLYGFASLLLALPVFYYHWQMIYFLFAILPFSLVHIYYIKQKNERAFLNDLNAIAIFAIAGMAAYYFPHKATDSQFWLVALYPSLFFIGTTLYVKSVLRERKNPYYYAASVGFHLLTILLLTLCQQYAIALSFVPALLRAMFFPKIKLNAKQVGLGEMLISLLFFIMLVGSYFGLRL